MAEPETTEVEEHFAQLCTRVANLLDETPHARHYLRSCLSKPLPSMKLMDAVMVRLVKDGRASQTGGFFTAGGFDAPAEQEPAVKPTREKDTVWLEGWTGKQWQVLRQLYPDGETTLERDANAIREGMGAMSTEGPLRVRVERVLWQEKPEIKREIPRRKK